MNLDERLLQVRARRLEVSERWVEKFAKRIGIPNDAVRLCKEILQSYYSEQGYIPHVERLTAAGALYTAAALLSVRIKGKRVSQHLIAKKAGIQPKSVGLVYKHILRNTDIKALLG